MQFNLTIKKESRKIFKGKKAIQKNVNEKKLNLEKNQTD